MKYALIAFVLVGLPGCAARPRVIAFSGIEPFTVIYTTKQNVNNRWDAMNGPSMDGVLCMFEYATRTMWISYGNEDCILHELCHAMYGKKSDDECHTGEYDLRDHYKRKKIARGGLE